MTPEAAEKIALDALLWIAASEELSGGLLGMSGAAASDLRERAGEPEFLGFVLDFLLMDEAALLAFCEQAGLHAETPMRARAVLPGGDLPNWT